MQFLVFSVLPVICCQCLFEMLLIPCACIWPASLCQVVGDAVVEEVFEENAFDWFDEGAEVFGVEGLEHAVMESCAATR